MSWSYLQLSPWASRSICFVCREYGLFAFRTKRWRPAPGTITTCWWTGPRLKFYPRCLSFWSSRFRPDLPDLSCSLPLSMNFQLCFWFLNEWWRCSDSWNWFCSVYARQLCGCFTLRRASEVRLLLCRPASWSILWQWRNLWSPPECSFDFNYFRWADPINFHCTVPGRKLKLWFDVHTSSWLPDKVLKEFWGWLLYICNRSAPRSWWRSYLLRFARSTKYSLSTHRERWWEFTWRSGCKQLLESSS